MNAFFAREFFALKEGSTDVQEVNRPPCLQRHEVDQVAPQDACRRRGGIIKSGIGVLMSTEDPTSLQQGGAPLFVRTKRDPSTGAGPR